MNATAQLGTGQMFDRIARRYDVLNRVLSFGSDQRWRRAVVRALHVQEGRRILDVATGTADLAILLARKGATVTGVDPSRAMLDVGREKVARAGLASRISLLEGIGESLPCEDASFDGACIAFGIRNVPDRAAALREMRRVVRPGGRLAILELNEPREGLLAPFARAHVHRVVPWIGSVISGDREYRYLARSIAAFPQPAAFSDLIESCGWSDVRVRRFTFGVACLFTATLPLRAQRALVPAGSRPTRAEAAA